MTERRDRISPEPVSILTQEEGKILLGIARETLERLLYRGDRWQPDLSTVPASLQEPGASFVTLYTRGELHGCIGTVLPVRPLAVDVASNAISAAVNDPRFAPLTAAELPFTAIEVSVLSPLQPVSYEDLEDLENKLRPGIDGVLLRRGWQRGLLLPQVWEHIPSPREFLRHVALKAGLPIDVYEAPDAQVYIFQVQSFEEPAPAEGHDEHRTASSSQDLSAA